MAALPVVAAFGDVDPTFHTATFQGFSCRNSPTLLGNDSMLVHLWDQRTVSSDPAFRHAIAKLKPDGSVDRTFGRDGLAEFVAPNNALNLMPLGDGRILAVGNRATRLLADGSVDTSYGQDGSTEEFFPSARLAGATLLPDGTLMVASLAFPDVQFAWFRADGRLATEFGLNGRLSGFRLYTTFSPDGVLVYAWSMQADGSVHLGHYSNFNPTPRVTRYRYDPSPPGMSSRSMPGVMPAPGIASWTSNTVKVDGFGGLLIATGESTQTRNGRSRPRASASTCTVSRLASDVQRVEATVIEYYHPALDHYLMTIEGLEVGILDDNRAAMGWVRTGKRFGAWAAAPVPGTTRLCRFYGDLSAGPNSHFYIPQGAGCEGLRQLEAQAAVGTKAWRLEGIVFSATEAAGGGCPGSLAPVYRFYNRGYEQGKDSNHRYATDPTVSAEMAAKG